MRIIYRLFICTFFSLLFSVATAQNTTQAEFNLMTITKEFPGKNYEKILEWSWSDESQRNFIFTFAPVKRLTDGSFVGTYIDIFSKVKGDNSILFLPAQELEEEPMSNNLLDIKYAFGREAPEITEPFQEELEKLDKTTITALNFSLAIYLSRYATAVHMYERQLTGGN
ncbi:MAG: hypothetical protein AAGI07_10730 [Bacteroidota bacterium]